MVETKVYEFLTASIGPLGAIVFMIWMVRAEKKSTAPKAHEKLDDITQDVAEIKEAILSPRTGIRDRLTVVETKLEERTGK